MTTRKKQYTARGGGIVYTILIVDDERNERTGIEKLIRRYQYKLHVLQAVNGKKALEKFEDNKIDILLTDIKMPVMSGMDLIREVHKRGYDPVCIIYSAYGEFEYAQDAISLGVIKYLLKPIKQKEFQELFEQVIRMCEEKDQRKEERERLKMKAESVENDRVYRQLLRYLDSETEELTDDAAKILDGMQYIPVILSSYSPMFSKYWESYEEELRKIMGGKTVIINQDDTQTLILTDSGELMRQKNREKICEELLSMSKNKYQAKIFIVMGNRCETPDALKKQYEIMKEQLDYQFFVTDSTYFLSEENRFRKKDSDMLSVYFQKILTCAKLGDFDGTRREFDRAFDYVEKNIGFSSIYIKYNFSEIIKQCCEVLHNRERLMDVVEDIYESRSISQVRQAVMLLMDKLEKDRKSSHDENRVTVMVKRMINERYQDYTLSVSSIADELGLSSAYVGTQFKAETHQQLVKYICHYRIEKAKELLNTTNMNVSDIARQVGYMNTSYFISLFRNNVGCTPAKFRERKFENEA